MMVQEIPVDKCTLDADQPRAIDHGHVHSLARSFVETNGLGANVIKVRKIDDDSFIVINGHHRLLAYQENQWPTIPAVVVDLDDEKEIFEDQVLDNFNRLQMSPMEVAKSFEKSLTILGSTVETLAAKVGKSEKFVSDMVSLTMLPDGKTKDGGYSPEKDLQSKVNTGEIGMEVAKALASIGDHEKILKAWKKVRRFKKAKAQKIALEKHLADTNQEKAPETEKQGTGISKRKAGKKFDSFVAALAAFDNLMAKDAETVLAAIMPNNAAAVENMTKKLRTLSETVDTARQFYLSKGNAEKI